MAHSGKTLLFGDLNARMPRLDMLNTGSITYGMNPDIVGNAHGKDLLSLCQDLDLYPLNLLSAGSLMCDGNLTFRQGTHWISQIDWAAVSEDMLYHIQSFKILQNIPIRTDHAALAIALHCPLPSLSTVVSRAQMLSQVDLPKDNYASSAIYFHRIDQQKFCEVLPDPLLLLPHTDQEVANLCEKVTLALRDTCNQSKKPPEPPDASYAVTSLHRWKKLLAMNDSKRLWNAVGWNGQFSAPPSGHSAPADHEFKAYFESLLAAEPTHSLDQPTSNIFCPVLDDPIHEVEVDREIRKMSQNKSPGPDGIPPGILTLLPLPWIYVLTFLLNVVFTGSYPADWCYARLVTVYKKGLRSLCSNYRGISVLSCLCKLYDAILNSRFTLWYSPDVQQAGAQAGRGCAEQILTIRLLIDVARKTKQPLYIAFLDYEKAYDKVDRSVLLHKLALSGCGQTFLNAIHRTLSRTLSIMGSAVINAKSGVRQGGSTSCSLFTFYINDTIRALDAFEPDGFLGNDHILLLMDDTVLLATSRTSMLRKLTALHRASEALKMTLHPSKSKFLTVNSPDRNPFYIGGVTISATEEYIYLGTPIANKPISEQVQAHIASKKCQARKFASFLRVNCSAPFAVKHKVWDSAMCSSILYSSETWFTQSLKSASTTYNSTLKQLLGVRLQTPNDLVHTELGVPPVQAKIRLRQFQFLERIKSGTHFQDSPLARAMARAKSAKSPMGKYLAELEASTLAEILQDRNTPQHRISNSSTTRAVTYKSINPELRVHAMYHDIVNPVPELHRIATTRLRLGSHQLKVETGRWARIPRDLRMCPCGSEIQTESHVTLTCPLTRDIRSQFADLDFGSICQLMNKNDILNLCNFCHCILQKCE